MDGLNKAKRLQKMASRKDYYKILGVTKEASESEIRRSYRKLALEWHPGNRKLHLIYLTDKHEGLEAKEKAEKQFILISEANEGIFVKDSLQDLVLSDPEKRTRYDNGEDIQVEPQGNPFQGFNFPGGFPGGGGFK
jgi:DnaJ family protein C protein 3